jgi:hypothetical protein
MLPETPFAATPAYFPCLVRSSEVVSNKLEKLIPVSVAEYLFSDDKVKRQVGIE